ncbi:antibiotic biosynthesis monooxygenase [Noviherbaspirillum denitrificans]|uniref:Antibiotic biosynthesis monooxygenase n=1 Tax=Noviherbaspirillum denitrificans TaxID=1968433 RepID=A0A254THB4_9BURK|nr:antibiotic biosynthesis monooxygenase [Noviherbaspirillum denitrificans]OWW19068.1 antibiotic biosynthesis monooxygenase [Noviherbaspirillum denitrificans]
MITRIWRGWTTHENAPVYEQLLRTEIFPGIAARDVAGYQGISLCRRELGNEVEFMTIMWFDSIESVKAFAGEAYEVAVVPPKARAVLSRFDERSAHYETIVQPPRR